MQKIIACALALSTVFQISAAEDNANTALPSAVVSNIVTIDIKQVQKGSTARMEMYARANQLSQNLEQITEKIQKEAEKRWQELNNAAQLNDEVSQEKRREQHRLWIEASERFILTRRLEIETKVGEIDLRIRTLLIDKVIASYAQEHNIDLILRDTQILYSRVDDVTLEILAKLNAQEVEFDLGIDIIEFDEILQQLDRKVALEMQSLFPH